MKWPDSTNRQLYSGGEAYGSQLLSKLFATLADQEIAKSVIIIILKVQWNLVIKRSDIAKPSYKKVIWVVPTLYIPLFFILI